MTTAAGAKKETLMDQFRLGIAVMAATDSQWGPRDADGRRRAFTPEELDALVDFGWHWPDVKGSLAVGANVILSRVRPGASNRIDPTPLLAAEAAARG